MNTMHTVAVRTAGQRALTKVETNNPLGGVDDVKDLREHICGFFPPGTAVLFGVHQREEKVS